MIEAARKEAASHAREGHFETAATIAGAANKAESAIQTAEEKASRDAIDRAHFEAPVKIDYPPF